MEGVTRNQRQRMYHAYYFFICLIFSIGDMEQWEGKGITQNILLLCPRLDDNVYAII